MIPSNILVFIMAFLILVIMGWIYQTRPNYNRIPKKIWTYWKNPDKIPEIVILCMETWKKHHPDYEIIMMNKKNFKGYVTIPEEIQSHHYFDSDDSNFSDLLCLYTLAEHGGIWIDPYTRIKEPFDKWLFSKYGECSGLYYESKDTKLPLIDTRFLACNKKSQFIKLWKEEFINIAKFVDGTQYADSRKNMGIVDTIPLVCMAAHKVLEKDHYAKEGIQLRKIEDESLPYLQLSVKPL